LSQPIYGWVEVDLVVAISLEPLLVRALPLEVLLGVPEVNRSFLIKALTVGGLVPLIVREIGRILLVQIYRPGSCVKLKHRVDVVLLYQRGFFVTLVELFLPNRVAHRPHLVDLVLPLEQPPLLILNNCGPITLTHLPLSNFAHVLIVV